MTPCFADGTETLGAPSIDIADGDELIIAGVGLVASQPGFLDITIPEDATVVQVIAYWEGLAATAGEQGDTDVISIEGISVEGERIGGVTHIINNNYTSTYRRDITALGLIEPGNNSLVVGGLDFMRLNDGVGLAVIVDTPSDEQTSIEIRDGNDYAFEDFAAPLDDTLLQTFSFEASDADREAELSIMLTHVSDFRSSVIEVYIDGVLSEELLDVVGDLDGAEWDSLTHPITIPAGATSAAIRPVSRDSESGPRAGQGTASVTWVFASIEVTSPAAEQAPGGCNPWLWALCPHFWDGSSENQTNEIRHYQRFNEIMDLPAWRTGVWSKRTLLDVVWFQGGWYWWQRIFNRQAATALANADANINYPLTVDEVIGIYRDALNADAGPETIKSAWYKFAYANYKFECPLY